MKAFRSFSNLRSLQITDVARDEIVYLCDILTAIDVINMDKYNLSCYQLTLGATFEDSTIKSGMTTEPIEEIFDGLFFVFQILLRIAVVGRACGVRAFGEKHSNFEY